MIGSTIGNLRIVAKIGKGGMGVVYLAEHLTLDKKFAVKSLSPALTGDDNFRSRFFDEARNQAMLGHVNIVQATDFIEKDGQFFFVMEFVDGTDLGRMIKQQGRISEKQALSIISEILDGLQDAHKNGIIHRDIKPSNILIDKNGHARITDFGIAMMLGGERLTATGAIIGSPWYMSPEQITRPEAIDPRSDIYSVGIVLYEMLTGDVPFDGTTEFIVKSKQVNEAPPDPHQRNAAIPPELAGIILKALEKSPAERFQQCQAFIESLTAYIAADRHGQPERNRRPWVGSTIAVVFILCISLLLLRAIYKNPRVIYKNGNDAARVLIQGTLEKASIICREFNEIEIKRKNIKIAEDLGDSALVGNYHRHIREKEQNVKDGILTYSGFIRQLAAMPSQVVDEAFGTLNRSLINAGNIRKAKLADRIESTYRSYKNNDRPVDHETMRQICASY